MTTPSTTLTTDTSTPGDDVSPIDTPQDDSHVAVDLTGLDMPSVEAPTELPSQEIGVPPIPQTLASDPVFSDDYARDEFGNLKYCKDGVTPQKKRGRKTDQKSVLDGAPIVSTPKIQQVKSAAQDISLNAALVSQTLIATTTQMMGALIGPEWNIRDKDEFNSIHLPLTKYLESKDVTDVPPGILLAIAIGGYAVSRFESQNTRTKLLGIAARVKMWGSSMWSKFRGQ